jgi:hypothetical protein
MAQKYRMCKNLIPNPTLTPDACPLNGMQGRLLWSDSEISERLKPIFARIKMNP